MQKQAALKITVSRDVVGVEFDAEEAESDPAYQAIKALFDKYPEEQVIDVLQQFYARRALFNPELYTPVANVLTEVYHLVV